MPSVSLREIEQISRKGRPKLGFRREKCERMRWRAWIGCLSIQEGRTRVGRDNPSSKNRTLGEFSELATNSHQEGRTCKRGEWLCEGLVRFWVSVGRGKVPKGRPHHWKENPLAKNGTWVRF